MPSQISGLKNDKIVIMLVKLRFSGVNILYVTNIYLMYFALLMTLEPNVNYRYMAELLHAKDFFN